MCICDAETHINSRIEKIAVIIIMTPGNSRTDAEAVTEKRKIMFKESLSQKTLAVSQIVAGQIFLAQFHAQTGGSQCRGIASVQLTAHIIPDVHIAVIIRL